MPKRVRSGLTRTDILHRYVERFKQQLDKLRPFLSRKRSTTTIEDFDEAAEELISQVFGAASDEAEAYFYAKNGESACFRRRPRKTERTTLSVKACNSAGRYWKVVWPISRCVAWFNRRQAGVMATALAVESRRLHVPRRAQYPSSGHH